MRQRLLFLCHTFPYPPHQGVEIRALNILRILAQHFDVQVLCFHQFSSQDLQSNLDAIAAVAPVRAFRLPQAENPALEVVNYAMSLVSGRLYTHYRYNSSAFRAAVLAELVSNPPDLVHIESLGDLVGFLPILNGMPVIATHHNVESELLRRRAQVEGSAARRRYIALQADRMERTEAEWAPRVDLNIAVSDHDRAKLLQIAPDARVEVISNGVDTDVFRPSPADEEGMVFVGGSTWFPNRDALEYFAAEILPRIRREIGDVRVRWVGRATHADRLSYAAAHGIELTGYVEDIRALVSGGACYIVPLRVGGGTRLKILDAWAMGKAVVSTPVGCEGLEVRDGENILIRDTPETFAAGVIELLQDKDRRTALGNAARETAVSTYSWPVIGKKLIPLYQNLTRTARLNE